MQASFSTRLINIAAAFAAGALLFAHADLARAGARMIEGESTSGQTREAVDGPGTTVCKVSSAGRNYPAPAGSR